MLCKVDIIRTEWFIWDNEVWYRFIFIKTNLIVSYFVALCQNTANDCVCHVVIHILISSVLIKFSHVLWIGTLGLARLDRLWPVQRQGSLSIPQLHTKTDCIWGEINTTKTDILEFHGPLLALWDSVFCAVIIESTFKRGVAHVVHRKGE